MPRDAVGNAVDPKTGLLRVGGPPVAPEDPEEAEEAEAATAPSAAAEEDEDAIAAALLSDIESVDYRQRRRRS